MYRSIQAFVHLVTLAIALLVSGVVVALIIGGLALLVRSVK